MPFTSLHLIPVEGASPLPLPPEIVRRPWRGTGSATGGGLAVRISPVAGVREVIRGSESLALPEGIALPEPETVALPDAASLPENRTLQEATAGPETAPFLGPGSWCRPLHGGGEERGAILEPFPVLVVQRLGPRGGGGGDDVGDASEVAPPPTHRPVLATHLLAPDDVSGDTLRRLARSLSAWVLRRQNRGSDDAGFEMEGMPALGHVAPALRALDDASLADPVDDPAEDVVGPAASHRAEDPLLLAGAGDAGLVFVSSSQRLDVALGALAGGRWTLAWRILEGMLSDTMSHPASDLANPTDQEATGGERERERGRGRETAASGLFLATRWAFWTGEVERLRVHGEGLDRAARELARPPGRGAPEGGTADRGAGLPAAFPSAGALLDAFADAMEPLGDRGWVAELRAMARQVEVAVEVAPGATSAPAGRGDGARPRLSLPVVGSSSAGNPAGVPAGASTDHPGPRPAAVQLPPIEAFASPTHPGLTTRRAVHAARLVRSAVEDLLGVRPDASYGRITLAPDLRRIPVDDAGVRHLAARGLRVGDARIDLDCRITGTGGSLRVCQVAGRVPVNVVFEPRLPLAQVRGVELAGDEGPGDPANVDIHELDNGVRLRFQFPLDPARRITVDGTA